MFAFFVYPHRRFDTYYRNDRSHFDEQFIVIVYGFFACYRFSYTLFAKYFLRTPSLLYLISAQNVDYTYNWIHSVCCLFDQRIIVHFFRFRDYTQKKHNIHNFLNCFGQNNFIPSWWLLWLLVSVRVIIWRMCVVLHVLLQSESVSMTKTNTQTLNWEELTKR